MKGILLLATLVALSLAFPYERELFVTEAFEKFITKFNKQYNDATEKAYRKGIFSANLKKAEMMNRDEPFAPFGITQFMDLSPKEFKQRYLNYVPSQKKPNQRNQFAQKIEPVTANTTAFDWRHMGAVTKVKNQGQCGSCWAFSATEAIESAHYLKHKVLPVLAPQQIVDCDKNDGGCGGGDTVTAYAYVEKAGGLDTEASYPYKAKNGECKFKAADVQAKISGFKYATKDHNENEMLTFLQANGPLSICVDASSWQFYNKGVIIKHCGQQLDHCVQVTGFNSTKDDKGVVVPIWNVRNSWGESWGEAGYIWIERGKNLCGISNEVTWPTAV